MALAEAALVLDMPACTGHSGGWGADRALFGNSCTGSQGAAATRARANGPRAWMRPPTRQITLSVGVTAEVPRRVVVAEQFTAEATAVRSTPLQQVGGGKMPEKGDFIGLNTSVSIIDVADPSAPGRLLLDTKAAGGRPVAFKYQTSRGGIVCKGVEDGIADMKRCAADRRRCRLLIGQPTRLPSHRTCPLDSCATATRNSSAPCARSLSCRHRGKMWCAHLISQPPTERCVLSGQIRIRA